MNDVNGMFDFLSFKPRYSIPLTTSRANDDEEESLVDEYLLILNENITELFQLKWEHSAVESLQTVFNSSQIRGKISSIKTALIVIETIVNNHISLPSHIHRIVQSIKTRSVEKWMEDLNAIIDEQGQIKTISVLLEELASRNPSVNIVDLQDQYERVMDFYRTETSQWTLEDIRKGVVDIRDRFFAIAMIIRAAHLFKQYRPRDIQIISLLLLINQNGQGRLAQIRTGEGKSLIVSMSK